MKFPYIILITCILLTISINASPQLYYKAESNIDLKVPCINNNAPCSAIATCNITINYPNGRSFINNKAMNRQLTYFNYTLNHTTNIGSYETIIFCTDAALGGYSTFTFEINNTGDQNVNVLPMSILIITFSIICMMLTFVFWERQNPLFYMFLILTFLCITLLFFFIYMYTTTLNNVFYTLYIISGLITFFVFGLIMVDFMIKMNQMWSKKKTSSFEVFK